MTHAPARAPTESADIGAFLAAFFVPPNGIALSDIAPTGQARHLVPWVDRLRGEPPLPTVLPCRCEGRVWWYGLAFSEAQLGALGDQLMAFVGPTRSTFRGHRALLDPHDPIDASVLLLTRGSAYKFTGPLDADEPSLIWRGLELMRTVAARRPDRVLDAPRPTGRVLRDFYMALRAGNGDSAEANLRYLAEYRRLTPNNILFLRVQALAELGDWDTLIARPELPDLLQMRRPVAVTEALLRAVYHRELLRFERAKDLDGAVAHFRGAVLPAYGLLFARRAGVRAPEALKALMLLAVAGEPPDPELRDSVWTTRGIPEDDRLYLKLLADRLPAAAAEFPADPLQAALSAHDQGDYDGAFTLALVAPPTPTRARLLVECAYELQTLEVEREAVSAVRALAEVQRAEALRGRRVREIYDRVVDGTAARQSPETELSTVAEAIPANWIEWVERVGRDESWGGALDVARRGALEWNVEDLLSVPGAIERLADLLGSSSGGGTVQNALPQLVAFFGRDALWPRSELGPVYVTILDLLAIGSTGAEDDVRVYVTLAEALLELGMEPKAYAAMIAGARHLLVTFASPSRIQWGLELLEATVALPCPDETHRLDLLLAVAGLVQKFWRRVDDGQRVALRLLCQDLGQPEVFDTFAASPPSAEAAAPNVLERLNGRTVAIYTLAERAARYMQQILAEQAPQAIVHLRHDEVASEGLRQLARRADIFIMATASAKHAATEFIEANRPADRPLLRPAGKGMGSMLRVLAEFLKSGSSEDRLGLAS